MLGEGLCPAANEYAAPPAEDCGGGGGGGGRASCTRQIENNVSSLTRSTFHCNFTAAQLFPLSMKQTEENKGTAASEN